MNTTSLEISKKLYEVSGWGNEYDIDLGWYNYEKDRRKKPKADVESYQQLDHAKDHGDFFDGGYPEYLSPAYSLGYLLRKLPYRHPNGESKKFLTIHMGNISAVASYQSTTEGIGEYCRAGTPEDALAKLAIMLFDMGLLQ